MTTQNDRLGQLSALGVAVWLDDISRDRLSTGNLAALMRDFHVIGVTSNPTIFASALSKGTTYSDQVHDLAVRQLTVDEAARDITTFDIRWACDVLRPAFDATGGLDGRVSIEVDPRIARDTEKTVAEAKALWWRVDRPNLFIKIPATKEGLPAITRTLAEGISVNVTLIFSLERYAEVIDAFMAGVEQAPAESIKNLESVASFFVSRVDTEVDARLDKIGTPEALALRGQAAVANARLAYELYEQRTATDRWAALHAAGARPQRPLWASTSTKNPEYSDTLYVTELVAPGIVNTMPEATLRDVADHGELRGDTIHGTYDASRQYFEQLAAVGVSYDDVVRTLEDEGVDKFAVSWNQLLETIKTEMDKAASGDR
jgi:transaldolase